MVDNMNTRRATTCYLAEDLAPHLHRLLLVLVLARVANPPPSSQPVSQSLFFE